MFVLVGRLLRSRLFTLVAVPLLIKGAAAAGRSLEQRKGPNGVSRALVGVSDFLAPPKQKKRGLLRRITGF